jgi:wyosine [tRNA(Phe)-imidazoG37] synthetase (radical SAM superfamily)
MTLSSSSQEQQKHGTGNVSTVYGPVQSWRYGWSLGIDLIRDISTCSFNCIYCQLGDIVDKTAERREFISTKTVIDDLQQSDWQKADIITFSGSGEPTLATNLGEAIQAIRDLTQKPILVLTNATLLNHPDVIRDLQHADTVAVKLDAPSEAKLQQMNRPVAGVTLETIIDGIKAFKAAYNGKLSIQSMFMPTNADALDEMIALIRDLAPDELQLNTPKRPYPLSWHVDSRGNHSDNTPYETRTLRTISLEEARHIEARFRNEAGVKVLTIYPES